MFPLCRHNVPIVTGLIYVVIIALWAAVLIPIWLRRHDHISEVRSTARFSSAMKSLSGRGQMQYAGDGYDDGYGIDPAHSSHSPQQHRGRSLSDQPRNLPEARMTRDNANRPPEGTLDRDYERELVRQQAATRRAMVLGGLTVLLLVVLVLAIVGVVPQWAPILAAVPVLGFVIATAMTASARSGARPAEQRDSARGPRRRERLDEAVSVPAHQVEDDWETWNAWDDDDDAWDAVPTTLPTYVDAPRASAVPRGIDRSHPNEWTGEAMVETARAMRSRPLSEPLAPASHISASDETTEIPVVGEDYQVRRAANQ